jgi:hypothetical protein
VAEAFDARDKHAVDFAGLVEGGELAWDLESDSDEWVWRSEFCD